MPIVYFDSSALVKLLIEEVGTDVAVSLWDGADAVLSSRLAYAEVRAALAAANRNGTLAGTDHLHAKRSWEYLWRSIRPVELSRDIEQRAGELAEQYALRGADSIHLASALAVPAPELLVAVWDRRLHAGVVAAGLAAAPAQL